MPKESIKARRARLEREKQEQLKMDVIRLAAELPEPMQMALHNHSLMAQLSNNQNEAFLRLVNNDDSLSQTAKNAALLIVKAKAFRMLVKSSCKSFEVYQQDKAKIQQIHDYFKNRGGWNLETQNGTDTQFYVKTIHKPGAIQRTFVMAGITTAGEFALVNALFDSITKKPIDGKEDVSFLKTFDELIKEI